MTAIDIKTPERLDPGVFDHPVHEIRIGYRSAEYFNREKQILEKHRPDVKVTMQVFQKGEHSVLCGVDEAISVLKLCSGRYSDKYAADSLFRQYVIARAGIRTARPQSYRPGEHPPFNAYRDNLKHLVDLEERLEKLWEPGWDQLEVRALYDGDVVQPWEPVMTITGPAHLFAHLESVYLGILARRTRIATNTARVVRAAEGKPVLFFADRFDHYATQGGDGYAAHVGGSTSVATPAMGKWWGQDGMGTMPHALIAAYDGNLVAASQDFRDEFPDVDLVALVDFTNDCVRESVSAVKAFGEKLAAVRLDTSENMVDASITRDDMGDFKPTGVNPMLVHKVRAALDGNGGQHVKIVVSGGFTAEKIREFETQRVPVDVYAVGSSLLRNSIDFTADIVSPVAKKGRCMRPAHRLEVVQ